MFAGKLNTGLTSGIPAADDPMTASCQPNFAILSTDGYWNKEGGQDLAGTAMGNQDNVDSGYSTRAAGAFDGACCRARRRATRCRRRRYARRRGDVLLQDRPAHRPEPVRHQQRADHQQGQQRRAAHGDVHLGLGLDGELTYRTDYETASTGDFANIKAGVEELAVAGGDTPSALDDLWHAAVNGRGVFFRRATRSTLSTALERDARPVCRRGSAPAPRRRPPTCSRSRATTSPSPRSTRPRTGSAT